jgi:crotonobetainyl-CoA:carnitine CoA-transferase CaiB-like acyl-CoA transferase
VGALPSAEVLAAFEAAEAAIAPVYTMLEVMADPHVQARKVFVEVDGVVMQGPVARLSRTPAELRWAGRALGADTEEVLGALDDR